MRRRRLTSDAVTAGIGLGLLAILLAGWLHGRQPQATAVVTIVDTVHVTVYDTVYVKRPEPRVPRRTTPAPKPQPRRHLDDRL